MRRQTNRRLGKTPQQRGKGPLDTITNTLKSYYTEGEFPGERHAISMDPRYKGQKMQYNGPGTNLSVRLARGDPGINDLDRTAKKHDIDYNNALMKYKQTGDKKQFMSEIHKADKEFIPAAWSSRDDPQMGKVSAGLMTAKMLAEKTHIIPTGAFSGAGKSKDPVANLRKKLIDIEYNTEERMPSPKKKTHRRKSRSRSRSRSKSGGRIKRSGRSRSRSNSSRRSRSRSNSSQRSRSRSPSPSQHGGIPIGPIISILSTVGPPVIEYLWNKFKGKKQEGSGYRGGKLHTEDKREILIRHLQNY